MPPPSSSSHTPHAPTHPPTSTLSPSDRSHPGRTASSPSPSSYTSSSSSAQGREKERKRKKRAPPLFPLRSTLGGEAKEKRGRSRKSKGRALSPSLSFPILSSFAYAASVGRTGKGKEREEREEPSSVESRSCEGEPVRACKEERASFDKSPYCVRTTCMHFICAQIVTAISRIGAERKQRGAFSFLPSPSVIRPHQRVISPPSEQIEGGLPSLRPAEKEGKRSPWLPTWHF